MIIIVYDVDNIAFAAAADDTAASNRYSQNDGTNHRERDRNDDGDETPHRLYWCCMWIAFM